MKIEFKTDKSESTDILVTNLVSELMDASILLHKLHLRVTGTGSYAQHKALNEIYDSLKDKADDLAEQYQGASEKLLDFKSIESKNITSVKEAIQYLNQLKSKISFLQTKLIYSEIVNLLDEIKSDINSAKYKLIFLS